MKPILFLFAALALAAGRAQAQPPDVHQEEGKCFDLYQTGEYDKAADCYNTILYSGRISDTARLVSCYERLGVCLTMLDKKAPARGAFIKLLDMRPEYELDPNVYLPEVISLFQIAKFEQKTSLKVLIMDSLPAYPIAINFAPFGAPQFMNHKKSRGILAAGLQGLTLLVSVYAYNRKQSYYSEEYGYREEDVARARQWDYTQRVAFFGLAASYVYSLVDGFMDKRLNIRE
jgi:hypothetical protein